MIHHAETYDACPACDGKAKFQTKYTLTPIKGPPKKVTMNIEVLAVNVVCEDCGLIKKMNIEQLEADDE